MMHRASKRFSMCDGTPVVALAFAGAESRGSMQHILIINSERARRRRRGAALRCSASLIHAK